MKTKFYVYQYLRKDGSPYYIGKGSGLRYCERHRVAVPKDPARINFVAIHLYEDEAFLLEKKLIKLYGRKDLGTGILQNMTDGGDGKSGVIDSEHTRMLKGKANKGRKRTEEQRARITGPKGMKIHSDEEKEKRRERMKGNTYNTGRKQTSEEIAKRVASNTGRKTTDETKAKIAKSNTGQKRTPEQRENMRQAALRRRERERNQAEKPQA